MPGFVLILGIVVAGALLGFFFSKKGQEREGAIQGAKFSCGCICFSYSLSLQLLSRLWCFQVLCK